MNKNIKTTTRFSISVDDATNEKIENIMSKTNRSKADVTRELIQRGLSLEWQDENADAISMLVKKQVDVAMKPHVERLASLISKSGHMSARSAFLNAQVLLDIVDKEKRRDVFEIWESASKKAVEYMKTPLKGWDYFSELIKSDPNENEKSDK